MMAAVRDTFPSSSTKVYRDMAGIDRVVSVELGGMTETGIISA
jgi:hypothetical protein